jgi:hypothetical protein
MLKQQGCEVSQIAVPGNVQPVTSADRQGPERLPGDSVHDSQRAPRNSA